MLSKPCLNKNCFPEEVPLCRYCPNSKYRSREVESKMQRIPDGKTEVIRKS